MTPVLLVRGDDPTLVVEALQERVAELVGDGDRTLLVDELAGDDYELAAAVDAARTPPFLTDRRIVVARTLGRFSAVADLTPLLDYLQDPLESTTLVLVWEPGTGQPRRKVPKKLADAVTSAAGEVVDAGPGRRKSDRRSFVDERLRAAGVSLDRPARAALDDQLGEDLDRLGGVLATLVSTYGAGARIGTDEIEPFLGVAGEVPVWELTDTIDAGDIAGAIDRLHRLMGAGGRHGLQIMATLHTHYRRMLRLDGEVVADEATAAELLGVKGFPASKALRQSRRLGGERIAEAVALLATADLDLRGARDWDDRLVMEVLVARLARLSRR